MIKSSLKFHEYTPYRLGLWLETMFCSTHVRTQGRAEVKIYGPETELPRVFFSFFATHCANMLYPSVKFHEYIPYGLGLMAMTQFL